MSFPLTITSPSGRTITLERDLDFNDLLLVLEAADSKENRRLSVTIDRGAALHLGAALLAWSRAPLSDEPVQSP